MTEKTGKDTSEKLDRLRAKMAAQGLTGYLVPRADEWQGEYVPARAERLAWLTGFTGSAGLALVLADKAAVYSDGRYTLQMKNQVDGGRFATVTMEKQPDDFIASLKSLAPNGGRIGFDPRLHSPNAIARLSKALADAGITFVPVDQNLVDAVWDGQPEHPMDKVAAYDEKYAGRSSADKRADIAGDVKKEKAAAFIVTKPDSIAWLLNIRGTDVPHVPVALSYAVVHENGEVDWFIPRAKVPGEVLQHIGNQVRVHDFADMEDALTKLAKKAAGAKQSLLMDFDWGSVWFKTLLEKAGAEVKAFADPTTPRKAIKNDTEKKWIEDVHVRDGVALVKFWKWVADEAPKGELTELSVEKKLLEFRMQGAYFQDTSFDSIVGWAANGAIVHYRATPASNTKITGSGLLLVDSGGQYLGATTDNTRTVAIGDPTGEMKDSFTRVLKGHIAVATARFSKSTTGKQMDMLARQFLHKTGMDFGHGTGHGVGAYLSVHEDGVRISKQADSGFRPGMLVSNEPGYYKEGAYGIRIENLVMVEEVPGCKDENLKYKFNTVSLTPIDRKLIDVDLLDADEIRWLNEYHQKVFDRLSPHLNADEKAWLKKETAPIGRAPAP